MSLGWLLSLNAVLASITLGVLVATVIIMIDTNRIVRKTIKIQEKWFHE